MTQSEVKSINGREISDNYSRNQLLNKIDKSKINDNGTGKDELWSADKISSQIKEIVHLIDNPNFELIGDGEYKLINDITLESTLSIPDNTKIKGFGKIITSNFDGVLINAQGKNITIDGLKIDCNNKSCTGILVNTNSEKVNVINNEIYNSYGKTTNAVYGIFISAIGCNDINIKNNFVHDIISNADEHIGNRDGGWAKGIIVDLYDVINERPSSDTTISTNITIDNNTIINIQDFSDGDGIYIEGYRCSKNSYMKVINNFLKKCGKRFIKVLNAGGVDIIGNYGINEDSTTMHSFISIYTGNVFIKDNTMKVLDGFATRYGVEIGYQAKYEDIFVNDILIEDNKFDIGVAMGHGSVIARPDYDGKLNNVTIKNNLLCGGGENINFSNGAEIKQINILDNVLKSNVENRSAILINNVSVDKLIIERNKLEENSYDNAIVINNLTQGEHLIKNNEIGQCTYTCIKNINSNRCIIEDNIFTTTTTAYTIENTSNIKTNNNFDLRVNEIIEKRTEKTFVYKIIEEPEFTIDVTDNSQIVTLKLMPTVNTTLETINATVGQIIIICTGNNNKITISHSADIHLKNNESVIFNSMEKSITLVKLDNRLLEISRNF